MKVTINGQQKEIAATSSLKDIVDDFSHNTPKVVAELNEEIIRTEQWSNRLISEGDKIELISFVGGGA